MRRKILLGLLAILLVIQLFPSIHNTGTAETPQSISHVVHVPDTIYAILKTSCFDCHSNHTEYPWYAKIQPVGFWLNNHIEEGKEHLNFSEFAKYSVKRKKKKLSECEEEVEEHKMPLESYLWIHSNAVLSAEQVQLFKAWAKKAAGEVQD